MRIYAKSADSNGDKEPLYEHTRNDINVGRVLVQNLPFPAERKERIGKDLDLIMACHDLGKAATGFQTSLDTHVPWGKRHEIISAAFATNLGLPDRIIFSVITHHKSILSSGKDILGCLPDAELPFANHIYPIWQQMATEWYANLSLLKEEWLMICKHIHRMDLADKVGLAPLSSNILDWLERDIQADTYPYQDREYFSLLRGLTMSADHIASSGSPLPVSILRLSDFKLTPYQLRGFQIAASKHKGSLILRAPTGSGKTEAALLWSQLNQEYNGRMFYSLPTKASINAMYLRVKDSFNDFNDEFVALLHSRAASALYSLFEENGSEALINQQRARSIAGLIREMYYPIRVCTPHQILRYSLQGKGWEAMLSEFPNSVFIFDEIHAYNPKLTGLIMATVRYLVERNATCMFITATLPRFIREKIEKEVRGIQFIEPSYSIDSDRMILEKKRHVIEAIDSNIIGNIDLIAREAEKARSTLVICNHVPTAQAVYTELRKNVSDTILLHSRFSHNDRNKKEISLRDRLPKILVATQVVEVSLNLDFEQCFTEPAAIDALVQRFGRVNRYGARNPAKVGIFTEQYSKNNNIYSENLRHKSLKSLTSLSMPLSEEDLNYAADQVYGNGYDLDDQIEYYEGLEFKPLKQWERYLTAGVSKPWIEDIIDEKEGSIELLHEQFQDENSRLREQGKYIAANSLLIPVGKWALSQLEIDKEQDPWVLLGFNCRYSENIGLEIG